MLADVREKVGDEEAALASWFEFPRIGGEKANFSSAGVDVLLIRRQRLPRVFFQCRLVVERVNLAWPAVHDQEDACLGFGREVGWTGREWILRVFGGGLGGTGLAIEEAVLLEQARQGEAGEARAHLP